MLTRRVSQPQEDTSLAATEMEKKGTVVRKIIKND